MSNFDRVLKEFAKAFLAIVLVDPDNRPVARYMMAGLDASTADAPLETARRILQSPERRADLESWQESVFYDLDGRRLVCRPLRLASGVHLLIVLTAADKSYRRQLGQLVNALKKA